MTDLDYDAWAEERGPEPQLSDTERIDNLEGLLAQLMLDLKAKEEDEEPPPLRFETLPAFVTWFADWYRRDVTSNSGGWCSDWWKHPEAVIRLEAMWRVYEALRHDPATGISVWIRDHVDTHMGKLMADAGPFGSCRPGDHRDPLPPLPTGTPPEEWWTAADSGL